MNEKTWLEQFSQFMQFKELPKDFKAKGACGKPFELAMNHYQYCLQYNLTSVLQVRFSQTQKLFPQLDWKSFYETYLKSHPSQEFSLDRYGSSFPLFLETLNPNLPWLKDFATLELAIEEFFLDCPLPQKNQLELTKPMQAQSFRIMNFSYPILEPWKNGIQCPELLPSPNQLLIFYKKEKAHLYQLETWMADLLCDSQDGPLLVSDWFDHKNPEVTPESVQKFFSLSAMHFLFRNC